MSLAKLILSQTTVAVCLNTADHQEMEYIVLVFFALDKNIWHPSVWSSQTWTIFAISSDLWCLDRSRQLCTMPTQLSFMIVGLYKFCLIEPIYISTVTMARTPLLRVVVDLLYSFTENYTACIG